MTKWIRKSVDQIESECGCVIITMYDPISYAVSTNGIAYYGANTTTLVDAMHIGDRILTVIENYSSQEFFDYELEQHGIKPRGEENEKDDI